MNKRPFNLISGGLLMNYNLVIKKIFYNFVFIIMIFMLFTLFSCVKKTQHKFRRQVEVSVITVKPKDIMLTTVLPGRTSPYKVAEIRPQVSGILLKRFFKEGSDVKKGDLLYLIDPAPFKAAYNEAKAALDAAKKKADSVKAALEASKAEVLRIKANLLLSKKNSERFEKAYKDKAVSATQRDEILTKMKVDEATLTAAKAQVLKNQKALAVAKATIKQAEAALKSAKINLDYTRITAPISGRIGPSNITVGALVTAYQPVPLTTIHQLDPIYVDVPQSTNDLLLLKKRLKEGIISETKSRKVGLILDDGSKYPLEGTFKFRDVSVDPGTGSVILRMVFPNPEHILLPEMFVKAVIKEGIKHNAILVPQQAVNRDYSGNPFVYIVNLEDKVEIRPIKIDRAIGNKWLVTSGLNIGNKVVIEGLQYIRPGMKVKSVPFKKGGNNLGGFMRNKRHGGGV